MLISFSCKLEMGVGRSGWWNRLTLVFSVRVRYLERYVPKTSQQIFSLENIVLQKLPFCPNGNISNSMKFLTDWGFVYSLANSRGTSKSRTGPSHKLDLSIGKGHFAEIAFLQENF